MANIIKNEAIAYFQGSTVGAALTTTTAVNCSAVYTGVGIVTVTLATAVDQAECHISVTPILVTACIFDVTQTSDTVKVLRFFTDAGAAVETIFSMLVTRHV